MNNQKKYFMLADYDYSSIELSNDDQDEIDFQLSFADPIKAEWEEPIEFEFRKPLPRKGTKADSYFWRGSTKVFSNRIKEVIELMNVPDIDFIDAKINRKEEVYEGYFIMHVRRLITCFNKEKSKWKPPIFDPNKVMSIDKMVLDMDKLEKIPLQERLIFRLEECSVYHLFHESVVDAISALTPKPTGFVFVSVGAWHSGVE